MNEGLMKKMLRETVKMEAMIAEYVIDRFKRVQLTEAELIHLPKIVELYYDMQVWRFSLQSYASSLQVASASEVPEVPAGIKQLTRGLHEQQEMEGKNAGGNSL